MQALGAYHNHATIQKTFLFNQKNHSGSLYHEALWNDSRNLSRCQGRLQKKMYLWTAAFQITMLWVDLENYYFDQYSTMNLVSSVLVQTITGLIMEEIDVATLHHAVNNLSGRDRICKMSPNLLLPHHKKQKHCFKETFNNFFVTDTSFQCSLTQVRFSEYKWNLLFCGMAAAQWPEWRMSEGDGPTLCGAPSGLQSTISDLPLTQLQLFVQVANKLRLKNCICDTVIDSLVLHLFLFTLSLYSLSSLIPNTAKTTFRRTHRDCFILCAVSFACTRALKHSKRKEAAFMLSTYTNCTISFLPPLFSFLLAYLFEKH